MGEANHARYLLDPLYHHAVDLILFASIRAIEEADEKYQAEETQGAPRRTRYEQRRRRLLETLLGVTENDPEMVALAMIPSNAIGHSGRITDGV